MLALRENGLNDGEILEINQVVSYFAYVNRTVLGLGVTTAGDQLGLSPGEADWRHLVDSAVPSGTRSSVGGQDPPVNWWAIFICP